MKKPTAGTLADARKSAEAGEFYQALLAYDAGSIESLSDLDGEEISDKAEIRTALRSISWSLAEWLAFKSMISLGVSDTIDIEYTCPRCGTSRYRDEDEDQVKVSELPIKESEDIPEFTVDLGTPIVFKDKATGEPIETVTSLKFRLATLGDCMKAAGKVGQRDDLRLQFAIWAESLIQANGADIDAKWRVTWCPMLFERMDIVDARKVGVGFKSWAADNEVSAICLKCGKEYRQEVPTSSFFASALQGD
jgi:DNA-directed RNA polymerase subunit RPC12/RpoP